MAKIWKRNTTANLSHKHTVAEQKKSESWNSNLGVMLAVAGSAVGFGNFLRFPGLAAQFGGGAFMIAYFIGFLLLGIPISWVEWSIGRRGGSLGGHSTAAIFYRLSGSRAWKYLGIAGVLAPLALCMYYIYLEAWTLGYAWHTATGELSFSNAAQYGQFFNDYVGIAGNGSVFNGQQNTLVFFGIVLILNFYLIYRGVSKGIEWFCKWSMPVLLLTCIIILVRVLTMGTPDPAYPHRNINEGLGYMWNPDKVMLVDAATHKTLDMVPADATPEQKMQQIATLQAANPGVQIEEKHISLWQGLLNPDLWLVAAGQVFFSLSVGFGTVCTYASYVRRHKDVALGSLTANMANAATEIGLAGLMIIPAAVGFLGVAAAATTNVFGLGFNTLPQVFNSMPGGQFFGTLFFFLLFIAAITSAISMLQPGIAFLEEFWGLKRVQSITLLGFILVCGTLLVTWFTQGLLAMDTMDFWFGNLSLYLTTGLYLYLFCVVWGPHKGLAELRHGSSMLIPRPIAFIITWVTPSFMLIIFVSWAYKTLFVESNQHIANLIAMKPGAVFPLVWIMMVALFMAFVIRTSPSFHKTHKPD